MSERDELAAVIDAAVPHDAVPSFRFTHAVQAADAALRAGFRKAPAASEQPRFQSGDVVRNKNTDAVLTVRPPLADWEPFYYELVRPAVSEDVTERARAAVVALLRPELVEMDIARIDRDDDGELICDSPEVLDGAARRLANRAVEAVAGLLASHPVTDETVERLRIALADAFGASHTKTTDELIEWARELQGEWERTVRERAAFRTLAMSAPEHLESGPGTQAAEIWKRQLREALGGRR